MDILALKQLFTKSSAVMFILALLVLAGSCELYRTDNSGEDISNDIEHKHYEAEDAILREGITAVEDSAASGGQYVRMADSGAVVFDVDVVCEGQYELAIGYRSPESDKAQRLLVNDKEYAPEIGFGISAGWSKVTKTVGLTSGTNTVEIKKSWGNMDIDCLDVRGPKRVRPDMSPKRNVFYRLKPASDMSIKLDKNGNEFISITQAGSSVPFATEDVWYTEDAVMITIPKEYLSTLQNGIHRLLFNFTDAEPLAFELEVRETGKKAELTIVSFDVRHGTSVLLMMPTGKNLLVDTGIESMCQQRVIPFLDRHHIDLYELWITHYHDDHVGGKHLLEEKYPNLVVKDYNDFQTGDVFAFENTQVSILNSYNDGTDENQRSLSFMMVYRGFVYTHGGDIYGDNQRRIMNAYKADDRLDQLRTHVYHANHHFHGSVNTDYLRWIDPYLFVVSGEEHVYGRAAYTQAVQQEVLPFLRKENKRLIEDLLHFEVGHVVIRVSDRDHWSYETYKDLDATVPFLAEE